MRRADEVMVAARPTRRKRPERFLARATRTFGATVKVEVPFRAGD